MQSDWTNASFDRFERCFETSVGTARVVVKSGQERFSAYIKPLGNRLGPHVLACELVGTALAEWMGLPTLDYGIIRVDPVDEIWLGGGRMASPGPAFVTRHMDGHPWGGSADELDVLVNPEDVSRLVVFDTWTLNTDRCAPTGLNRNPHYDNVYLGEVEDDVEHMRLVAMDHTHCFVGGKDLTSKSLGIDVIQDDRVYGLFTEFRTWLSRAVVESALRRLNDFDKDSARAIISRIPTEWSVTAGIAEAMANLLAQRAVFLVGGMMQMLEQFLKKEQTELDFREKQGGNYDNV